MPCIFAQMWQVETCVSLQLPINKLNIFTATDLTGTKVTKLLVQPVLYTHLHEFGVLLYSLLNSQYTGVYTNAGSTGICRCLHMHTCFNTNVHTSDLLSFSLSSWILFLCSSCCFMWSAVTVASFDFSCCTHMVRSAI